MIQHKAYKFRIYPNKEQKILLEKTFGCVRFVYNHYLALRKEVYATEKRTFSYKECTKDLVSLKKESSFLKEVDSISLQQSLRHLDHAFGRFFADRNCGYPRFKSKKDHRVSYTTMCVNGNIRLTGRQIILPKVKGLNIRQHRDIPEGHRLKSVTVSRTPTGKYYVSILCEYEAGERRENTTLGSTKVIGLDFSMKNLFVSSEEEVQTEEVFLHRYRKMQKKLAKEQRKLSHCQKGSRRYQKQRQRVARLHERTADQRKDYLHKKSSQIANGWDVVCVEDLDMRGMSGSLHFGKSVHDNGWGMFREFLKYKLEERGKRLVKISRWYPSSKRCHVCGYIHETLELSDRYWVCEQCGTEHDRDLNASRNIKEEGIRILQCA